MFQIPVAEVLEVKKGERILKIKQKLVHTYEMSLDDDEFIKILRERYKSSYEVKLDPPLSDEQINELIEEIKQMKIENNKD